MFDEFRGNSYLFGANAPFIEALYDRYLEDPSAVEPRWRSYFDTLQKLDDGAPDVSHAVVQARFAAMAKSRTRRNKRPAMRGVPRARRAISFAPSSVIGTPNTRAPRLTIKSSSSTV